MKKRLSTTRPITASEARVLAVVVANVRQLRQRPSESESAGVVAFLTLADFKESFPSVSIRRLRELLFDILHVQWSVDGRVPMPILWEVQDKGVAFIVEVDARYLEYLHAVASSDGARQ